MASVDLGDAARCWLSEQGTQPMKTQQINAGLFTRALILCSLFLSNCSVAVKPDADQERGAVTSTESSFIEDNMQVADVAAISVSGEPLNYVFAVQIKSPDTGCDQYANWWEILTEDGELIYRRILLHSHIDEQPFTRTGGPVAVEANEILIVRAHMHPDGYGGNAFKGSVQSGFTPNDLSSDFAVEVEMLEPQPTGCNG